MPVIYARQLIYTRLVAKHLIDLDEDRLAAARVELGTSTIKDTVNEALRRATAHRERRVAESLDILGAAVLDDRIEAWR
jgi:Arc/MetJ family transcription regulator